MGDLTANFSRHEFACKGKNCCNNSAPVAPRLVESLQELRNLCGCALRVTSGFRCNKHNRDVGGERESQHTYGYAADIAVPEHMTADELAELASNCKWFLLGGIGVYSTWIHVDVRDDGPARWTL